jgi:thioredoxin-like negative regulator of GroEL
VINLIAFTISLVFAAAPTSLIGDALSTQVKAGSLEANLKTGFHFNNKAPNMVVIDGVNITPSKLGPREASFTWKQRNYKSTKAYLYICDDAVTFCEPRTIDLGSAEEAATPTTPNKKAAPLKEAVKINHHGFIQDDLTAAQIKATQNKSLILVDFAARWCPGCVRLENEVFENAQFKKTAQKLTKVRLDFDKFENLTLAKKYNVKFIPTLIILNTDLEEVARMVDYQPLSKVRSFIDDAQKRPESLNALKAKVDAGEKTAALLLGQRLYIAGQFADSVTYLSQPAHAPIELRDAQVQAALQKANEDKSKKKDLLEVIKKAVAAEPQSTRSLTWRTLWIENITDQDEKKKIAKEGLALADELLTDTYKMKAATKGDAIGEFTGYETLLIASRRADLLEAAQFDEATVLESYNRVADIGEKLKISPAQSGPALRYLIFLGAAKRWAEAEKYARALLKNDPKNPELQRRLLRVLNGLEKYPEAIQVGQKLLPNSFGKNEVWVALQLGKAHVGQKQPLEAKALAQTYLSRTDIEWAAMPKEKAELESLVK